MKKLLVLIMVMAAVFAMMFVASPVALAAGPDIVPVANIQSPVKAQADAMTVINAEQPANYASETLIPTGDGVAGIDQIDGFYTWGSLGTYSGLVAFVVFATQILKRKKILQKVDAADISYIVAVIGMACVTVFTGNASASSLVLCLINGFLISSAANALYNKVNKQDTTNNTLNTGPAESDPPGFEQL